MLLSPDYGDYSQGLNMFPLFSKIALTMLLTFTCSNAFASDSQNAAATVEFTQGFVYHKPASEDANYDMVGPRQGISNQGKLRTTKRALALLRSPGGHRLKVAAESEIQFERFPSSGDPQLQLSLFRGQLYTQTIGDPTRDDKFMGIKITIGPHTIQAHDGEMFVAAAGEKGAQEAIVLSNNATGTIRNQADKVQNFRAGQSFVVTASDIVPLGREYHREFSEKMSWSFDTNLKLEDHAIEL